MTDKIRDLRTPEGKAHMIAMYNQWNDEVKRTVPADKLLVFEVQQGKVLKLSHQYQ